MRWEIYDRLTERLPENEKIISGKIFPIWTAVTSTCGTGFAMTPPLKYQLTSIRGTLPGMSLKALAQYVRSWDFYEAALGLAAINSYYNQPARLPDDERILFDTGKRRPGIFGGFENFIKGKKVTMIGHGGNIDDLREICEFTVLERLPQKGDLPDTACEYILPEQDYVFITATALENKTMERLLELTENCFTVIWGPSTPLCEKLFDFGADALIGNMIRDTDKSLEIAGEGAYFNDFSDYTDSVMWFRDVKTAEMFRNLHAK